MIQIILNTNDHYSATEMAQTAIEAGCGWLIMPDVSSDELRETVPTLVELCRESGTILTIIDNIEAAKEYGLHGVLLTAGHNPAQVRQEIGAEAIIGAEIFSIDTATALAGADIDYYAITPDKTVIATEAKTMKIPVHFVALLGDEVPTAELIADLRSKGVDGICMGSKIFDYDDADARIARLLKEE